METDRMDLIRSYPRTRRPLPERQRAIYASEYKNNRQGKGLAGRLAQRAEGVMHAFVAAGGKAGATLEVGAGTLNHVPWEPTFLKEWGYDVVEPQRHLYDDSPHLGVVRDVFRDVSEVPAGRRYARVMSVAVLEHVEDLPAMCARIWELLEPGGVTLHGIPSEGGFLWGLGWRMTTGLAYRLRTGLSYGRLMRHEHVSDSEEIVAVCRATWGNFEVARWPGGGRHGSLYTLLRAEKPPLRAEKPV